VATRLLVEWVRDGQEFSAPVIMADMIRWERYARETGLPLSPAGSGEFPQVTYVAYLAYAAAVRSGSVPKGMTFAVFADDLESVNAVDASDGDSDADFFPNGRPDHGTDSP